MKKIREKEKEHLGKIKESNFQMSFRNIENESGNTTMKKKQELM